MTKSHVGHQLIILAFISFALLTQVFSSSSSCSVWLRKQRTVYGGRAGCSIYSQSLVSFRHKTHLLGCSAHCQGSSSMARVRSQCPIYTRAFHWGRPRFATQSTHFRSPLWSKWTCIHLWLSNCIPHCYVGCINYPFPTVSGVEYKNM